MDYVFFVSFLVAGQAMRKCASILSCIFRSAPNLVDGVDDSLGSPRRRLGLDLPDQLLHPLDVFLILAAAPRLREREPEEQRAGVNAKQRAQLGPTSERTRPRCYTCRVE